ncbi:carbohydrate ABC transporter permease [Streptacidiphilus sp. N1-12]|uniref:Carbohydrate ABC transporter permease n=2 Tax=Streptacidiphilus alkalitolerans TaxID=3342712 RepID=A0ABV6WIQ8_9ACTN
MTLSAPGLRRTPDPARTPSAPPRRTGLPGLRRRIRKAGWSYAYLAPMAVLVLVFIVYPIFASLGYTFYRWNGIGSPTDFVGLANFREVLHDSIFWGAVEHTFVYAFVLVPVQLLIALMLALVLNNPRLRFRMFFRTVYFVPVVTSAAVVGVVMQLMLSNFGDAAGSLLSETGLTSRHIDWLGDPHTALAVIIGIGIWHTLGYNLVYFMAGLQTIPAELYEAARIDGAGPVHCFRSITLPMLRPVGVVIVVLAFIGSFQVFDLVQVLTGGGPYFATEVVNTYIYHLAFGGGSGSGAVQPDVGLASAASFLYGLLLIVFSAAQVLALRRLGRRRAGAAL